MSTNNGYRENESTGVSTDTGDKDGEDGEEEEEEEEDDDDDDNNNNDEGDDDDDERVTESIE